ncbi:MAG: hypothetical protein HYZ17_06190 [Betaproteobacteria bacterium]|nr:hypothetical protein [Betaproteobacteria bacterium]
MAGIKFDVKVFWDNFLGSIKGGLLAKEGKEHTNKEIQSRYGIAAQLVASLFGTKGRNFQVKWTDEEMGRFNAGAPRWENRKIILAALLWGSKASAKCKSMSVERAEFEKVVTSVFGEGETDWENWNRGSAAAETLAAQRFKGNFVPDVDRAVDEYAAHFIGKLTNSNASTGALIAVPEDLSLPYLYSGSVGDLDLDCAINSSPAASSYRKMLECSQRVREQGRELSTAEDLAVADAFDAAVRRLGTGEDRVINRSVDWRLRQIVLPKDGGYVALTPLGAAGISAWIAQQSDSIRAQKIALPIGGTKSGNVTSIRAATQAFTYDVPSLSKGGIVSYLRLLHRGYALRKNVNKQLREGMDHYAAWLDNNRFVDDRNSVRAAEIEARASGIAQIVAWVFNDLRGLSNDIAQYLESLEDADRDQSADALRKKGVIETALVDGVFAQPAIDQMAERIVGALDGHKYNLNGKGKPKELLLGAEDRERLFGVTRNLASQYINRGQ